jgi:dTDP-L-rhamnose 4-epimerase
MSETILITGGAGFIGRQVVREALQRGNRVRVLDSFVEQVHGRTPAKHDIWNDAELLVGDVRDAGLLSRALARVDSVIHLAAEVGVGQSMYEIERYVGGNDLATAALFQALIDRPVRRVVTASSMSIYGEGLWLKTRNAVCAAPGNPTIRLIAMAAPSSRCRRRNGSARRSHRSMR